MLSMSSEGKLSPVPRPRVSKKEGVIPPAPVHETNTDNPVDFPKEKKVNPNTLSVWCLDKKEWRSFRVANVTNVEISE